MIYDIILKATIEIGGRFESANKEEALAAARAELRAAGELSDEIIERCVIEYDPEPESEWSDPYDDQPFDPRDYTNV